MTRGHAQVTRVARRATETPLWGPCVWAIIGLLLAAAVDPAAARRMPYHEHVVVGGTAVERARALAAHTRAMVGHPPVTDAHDGHRVPDRADSPPIGGRPSAADPAAAPSPAGDDLVPVRVLVLRAGGPVGPTVFGAGGGAVLASASPRLPAPRSFAGTVAPPWAPVPDVPPTTLDPPPRAS